MHMLASFTMLLASVLSPAKMWVPPGQPLNVVVEPPGEARLVVTDFDGDTRLEPKDPAAANVSGNATVDLNKVFEDIKKPGTYILYVVPKDKDLPEFLGTPLVINVREDRRRGAPAGPMITRVEPLRYAVMTTKQGPITMGFYYDFAPNTVSSFLTLASQGYFDGLTFHRIVPGFVVQGGDPRGGDPNPEFRGTGSPGYQIDAEFNERPHKEGVLSMARNGDPMEQTGNMPRCEWANSAGSQFFICLEYERTRALDRKYTAFGRVTDGMKAVQAVAAAPLEDPGAGRPREMQVIEKVEVKSVTAQENPYVQIAKLLKEDGAAK
jgi:peptidyl-prolyl cis-trans isomerase B (cyclophilin B)